MVRFGIVAPTVIVGAIIAETIRQKEITTFNQVV